MADYPSTFTSLARAGVGDIIATSFFNLQQDEIVAIQTELGKNPAGSYDSVVDRLDNRTDRQYFRGAVQPGSAGSSSLLGHGVWFLSTTSSSPADNTGDFSATIGSVSQESFVTINTTAVYTFNLSLFGTDAVDSTASMFGLSLNAQISIPLANLTVTAILVRARQSSLSGHASWTGRLVSGDVVRPHLDGIFEASAGDQTAGAFSVSKVLRQ